MLKTSYKNSSGQILLIVVVVMVVILTIGLSVASRTITNLKLSRQSEDSQKAFQAASAGVEKYLTNYDCTQTGTCDPLSQTLSGANFDAKIIELSATTLILNNGELIDQDRGLDVWLSDYPTYTNQFNGQIVIYWGTKNQTQCAQNQGENTTPALELLVLSGIKTSPTFTRYVYDACSRSNGFTSVTGGAYNIQNEEFKYQSPVLDFTTTPGLLIKVVPLYNSTKVAIVSQSGIQLPKQGRIIESVGKAGDATRKVIYYESYPQIPNEIFPYAILSQ